MNAVCARSRVPSSHASHSSYPRALCQSTLLRWKRPRGSSMPQLHPAATLQVVQCRQVPLHQLCRCRHLPKTTDRSTRSEDRIRAHARVRTERDKVKREAPHHPLPAIVAAHTHTASRLHSGRHWRAQGLMASGAQLTRHCRRLGAPAARWRSIAAAAAIPRPKHARWITSLLSTRPRALAIGRCHSAGAEAAQAAWLHTTQLKAGSNASRTCPGLATARADDDGAPPAPPLPTPLPPPPLPQPPPPPPSPASP
eukprot:COSAG01_NODE_857_length_13073_cov_13.630415_4_plen_254_part_00